jgi:putative ABC transport system ATP-binding protein
MPDNGAGPALLTVHGLATRAGTRRLHSKIDIDLRVGEILAVRGPSGCGKTTLLRTLAWLQDPAEGEVSLRAQSAEQIGWPTWRRRVVLVAQVPAIFPGSVNDNLKRPFTYHSHRGRPWPEQRARRLLERVRLHDLPRDAAADHLSVGQQQRLALVRALLLDPSVLLLDEPTSALDVVAAAAATDLIRDEVNAREAAALVVTHAPGEGVDRWYDRAIELGEPEEPA